MLIHPMKLSPQGEAMKSMEEIERAQQVIREEILRIQEQLERLSRIPAMPEPDMMQAAQQLGEAAQTMCRANTAFHEAHAQVMTHMKEIWRKYDEAEAQIMKSCRSL